jgi:hypothetical protein
MNSMKQLAILATTAAMLVSSQFALAAIDSNYYVADAATKTRFDIYNDGKNTFVEAIPGLIIRGATADGQRYIINGVPSQIAAQLNGKMLTVIRGYPPPPPVEKAPVIDPEAVLSRIEQISSDIKRLESLTAQVDTTAVNAVDISGIPAGPKVEEWIVPPGASMRDLVAQFAVRAGWSVDIKFNDVQTGLPSDLIFSGGRKITGTFKNAIIDTFSALPETSNVMAELRPDNDPPTLFIYRKGSK